MGLLPSSDINCWLDGCVRCFSEHRVEKGLRGIGAGALGCGGVREVVPVGGGDEGDSWTI